MRLVLCATGLALLLGLPAHAEVFQVTSAADSGPGTLRAAVDAANALPGADSIVFAEALGPIVLTTGQIDVSDTLSIVGPACGQVVSANFRSRILALRQSTATLTLENLVLTQGRPVDPATNGSNECTSSTGHGGAVCAEGALVIVGSSLIGNQAFEPPGGGAVFSDRNIEIRGSLIEDNMAAGFNGGSGGGLSAFGVVTIENSIVSNNHSSGEGGGIMAFGGLQVLRSEISNNTAGVGVGGLSARGFLSVDSSTISGNQGDSGGAFVLGGNVQISFSTVVQNTAAFFSGGLEIQGLFDDPTVRSVMVESSIVAGNPGPSGNFSRNSLVAMPDVVGSVFGDPPDEVSSASLDNLFLDNAGLRDLADNGCTIPSGAGSTKRCAATHAVPFSSPVRDVGSSFIIPPLYDQRGQDFERVIGPEMDIGAFESSEIELLFATGFE